MKKLLVSILLSVLVAVPAAAMFVREGDTTKKITFPMTQSSDHVSAFTGGDTFTVRYKLGEGSWTDMTTPTVAEDDDVNDPGEYTLSLDQAEMLVVPDGNDYENLRLSVRHANADTWHGDVTVYAKMSTLTEVAASMFTSATGETYAGADANSVVKQIADNAGGSALTVNAIVAGVWDANTADYNNVGSTGLAVATGGSTFDPNDTPVYLSSTSLIAVANAIGGLDVPGSFTSGELGYILGNSASIADFNDAMASGVVTLAPNQTVDVNSINGTSIAGTGSQVAAAFEHFFDVATPSKTINDVGVAGTGLTAQEVWEYASGRTLTALDEDTTTIDLNGSTIGTATTLTNLPAATSDWLTAAAVKADAVTKIQNGLATPTNITAGTITTVTNLTNAPTNGDLTATMKASVNAEVDTALNTAIPGSPTADSVNERVVAIDTLEAKLTSMIRLDGAEYEFDPNAMGEVSATVEGEVTVAAASVTAIQSGLATSAALEAVDNFVDTEVAAIKAKTDNLPASPAAVGSAMTLAADQAVNVTKIEGSDATDQLAAAAVALTPEQVATLASAISAALDASGVTLTSAQQTELVAAIKKVMPPK